MGVSWGIPDVLIDGDIRQAFPFLLPFGIIGLWRWSLFVLRLIFWLLYRPVQPKKNADGTSANKYKSSDVTIVVPTIDNGEEFMEAVHYWKINMPYEIIIVTSDQMKDALTATCEGLDIPKFRVLSVSKPNKRVQMCVGINAAETDIVALTDDDAIWTEKFLDWCLAPFDDHKMGGVGSKQIMMPVEGSVTFWEVIADFRLTMRMIETSASTFVDGGMSCLSGRTAIYRREILSDPEFQREFVNETWLGKYGLHSGDDKFITRWLVKNNWNMQMQNHKDACLKTTFKNNSLFLKQVLRWTRNTWRSDLKSIFVDRAILWRHPYVAFNMFDKFINPLPLLWGLTIIIGNLVIHGADGAAYVILPVAVWLLLSRTLRLVPHIIRKPGHIVYIPAMILFQYYFVFAKVYALFTLHITDWGSRSTVAKESKGKDIDESRRTDPEQADTCMAGETDSESSVQSQKKFVLWYKRPAVIIGAMVFPAILIGLVHLGFQAARQRDTMWQFALLSNQKSLTSDRATGAGVFDKAANKTFFAYAGPFLDPYVMEYDHETKTFVNDIVVGRAKQTSDYHDYPKMVLADDGKLVVVYTDSPQTLHVSKCDTAHTSECNWTSRLINEDKATYPCLTKASNGDLYTFYRTRITTDYRPLHYVKSTDHGETWSEPQVGIDTRGMDVNQDPLNLNEVYADCPRLEPAREGIPERFAMGWTMAGGGPGVIKHNNYHKDVHFAYFYPGQDVWSAADGTFLGSDIDHEELKMTLIFDSGYPDPENKRITDYYYAPSYVDETGYPIMVYNFNRSLTSGRWNGYEWEHTVLVSDAAYNLFDVEKTGENSFRLFHAQRDIYIFSTSDGAKTWEIDDQITPENGSVSKVLTISDPHPDMTLIAMENDWDLFYSEAPEYMSYRGTYRIWALREVDFNPIKRPSEHISYLDSE